MGKRASAPPPPDTSMYSRAQMDLSGRLRELGEEIFQTSQSEWSQLSGYAHSFMNLTLPRAEELFQWADEQRARYDTMVMPQIESLFKDAETYASKGEEQRQRGMAIQDVRSSMEAEREQHLRNLESYGIDPSMTRYAALDRQAGIAEAGLSALAANQAAERTKAIGRQLRADAINVGSGFINNAAAADTTATNIGATGANVGTQAFGAGMQGSMAALPYFSGASSAINSGAGIVDTAYGRQLDYAADRRASEADLGGIGNLVGLGLSMTPLAPAVLPAMAAMNGGNVTTNNNTYGSGAATGGLVNAPGGPTSDGGVLRVSDDEYIVPAEVVRKMGAQVLDKFVSKATGKPPPSTKQALPVR